MLQGKGNKSYRKKDLQNQKSIALGFKNLVFATQASGGETFLDLTSLVVPSSLSSKGFVNPSTTELLEAQLLLYKNNLILYRTYGGSLIPVDDYNIVTSSRINLDIPAATDEIFYGQIITAPRSGLLAVDGRVIHDSGILLAGETDIDVGQEFKINAYPNNQLGEVMLIFDGAVQMRNVNNATAAPSVDGNYEEVPVVGGLGSILRANVAEAFDRAYIVMSTVAVVLRPDGSRDTALEAIAGQVDEMIPTLASLAGVPESTFQGAPNSVQLKQFGERVSQNEVDIDTNETDINDLQTNALQKSGGKVQVDDVQVVSTVNDLGSVSGAIAIDWNDGNIQSITLIGNTTLSFTNPEQNAMYSLIVKQDGTGGRTLDYPAGSKGPGGAADITVDPNAVDMLSIYVASVGVYYIAVATDFQAIP